jgi:hypothetical protein
MVKENAKRFVLDERKAFTPTTRKKGGLETKNPNRKINAAGAVCGSQVKYLKLR